MRKTDFTGDWEFDSAASVLQIDVPDSIELRIEHDGPHFRLERSISISGRSDTFTIDLEVGREHPPIARGSATLHPSLRWEGDQLLFLTRIRTEDGESTNLVRYRLEAAGKRLVAREVFRGPDLEYDNTWVFHRQDRRAS